MDLLDLDLELAPAPGVDMSTVVTVDESGSTVVLPIEEAKPKSKRGRPKTKTKTEEVSAGSQQPPAETDFVYEATSASANAELMQNLETQAMFKACLGLLTEIHLIVRKLDLYLAQEETTPADNEPVDISDLLKADQEA